MDWDFKVPVGIACHAKVLVFRGFGLMSGITVGGGRTVITVRIAIITLLLEEVALRTGFEGLRKGGTVWYAAGGELGV